MPVHSFSEVFWAIREEHLTKRVYTFTESASDMLMQLEGELGLGLGSGCTIVLRICTLC